MFRRPRPGSEVVRISEALISGRYAEALAAQGRPIPAWAWTNLLAHASADQLRHTAVSGHRRLLRRQGVWCGARAYLAGEVLDAADRHGSLRSLQSQVLVPLELRLMAEPLASEPTPADWVTGVLTALQRSDRARRERRRAERTRHTKGP